MHSQHLIAQILHGKWFIEPRFADSMAPVISNLLNGYTAVEEEIDKELAFAVHPGATARAAKFSYWDGFDRAPAGSIAIIKLKGVLLKDDQYCGPIGTARVGEIIKAAAAHENIGGIVLHVDSPGGTVDGTEVLGNIIKAVEKPIVTFVDGLMASAAIWTGSFGDEIIASTDTDEIGSVGVMLSFADIQPYWESLGVKFHNINASTSPDKNKVWEELREGKYENFIKNVLDPLDKKFMNTIRENLPNVEDKHLTGKMFFARDLIGIIVDSIGSLDDAVERCSELATELEEKNKTSISAAAEKNKTTSTEDVVETTAEEETEETTEEVVETPATEEKTNIINMKQYKNVNTVLGVESLEAVDEHVSLNDKSLAALDAGLDANGAIQLQTDLDAANGTIGTQTTTISERDATIVENVAEIARLKGKAVEETIVAKTKIDDEDLNKANHDTVVSDDDDFATMVEKVGNEYLPS